MKIKRSLAELRERYLEFLIQMDPVASAIIIKEARKQGFDLVQIYLEILAPAQVEIGKKWYDGTLNVAQEHLATQITMRQMEHLRQKFLPAQKQGLRIVVSSVEGESHDIGARMVADFFYMDGWEVDYLGNNTPTSDLVEFVRKRKPDIVALSLRLKIICTRPKQLSKL